MYKRNSIKKLGRTKSHRDSLVRNLIISLFTRGMVKSTTPKAKELKRQAQSYFAKVKAIDNPVNFAREIENYLGKSVATTNIKKLVVDGAATFSIVKIGFRKGDNSEVSKVVIKELAKGAKVKATVKKEKATKEAKVETQNVNKGVEIKSNKDAGKVNTKTVSKERSRARSGL